MADSDVPITAGSGTKIDTRTVGAGTDEHRQVIVIGDPVTAANVASADAANGLDVDVTRLPALVAGTANIGDVDVLTVPAPLSTAGGGTEATALRVTVATDSTGVLSVDDNGGALTVDSTQLPAALAAGGGLKIEGVAAGVAVPTNVKDSLGQSQYNFPAGFVRVSDEPRQVFYDPFDAALDTTNRWNAAVSSGGGVAAAVSGGSLTLGSGTVANGYSVLTSQPSIIPTIPGWLGASFAISIESAVGNNARRFWGMGSAPGTPTAAIPVTNGYGFELDTSGVLWAVVYSGGTRTQVASLAASQPADANFHRYIVYYRTDRIFWYIDSLATPAATSDFQSPAVQTLPVNLTAVAHTSGPAASRVITCAGLAVWDTAKNGTQITDGTYQWRKATVDSSGRLSVLLPGSLTGKAEDTASAPADVGLPTLGVRNDTPTVLVDTDGDYAMIAVDKYGRTLTAPIRSLPKSIQVSGSLGITTAAVWNDKAVWVVPANFLFAPKMARAGVTTAGTRTLVLAGKQLATFNPGTNAFTATGSVSSPDFYDRLFYRVATTHSATADTVTATYVDQDGNAGNSTGGLVIAASAAGQSWFEFILAANDFGVRSVSAVVDTAAPTSVVDEIWGFRTLLEDLGPALTPHIAYLGEGLQIPAAESVVILFNAAATTAQQRFASVLGDLVAA